MTQPILLVDDEEGIRKVLGISLSDSGYRVLTAESGEEALRLFGEARPRVVLTDIKMPGMDGIELLKKIKEQSPETEVIMITGHGDMELAIQSLKFDAADFITKPINDEILEIALKKVQEKIALKERLKEYTEDLERLVEEKTQQLIRAERLAATGRTVAGLAHAIKNMTGGLTGGAFVLEKGIQLNNDKYLAQGWEMIKGNLDRIKSLALDLLGFSRERTPDFRLCDPNKPAREVAQLMGSRCEKEGLKLEVALDDGLPEVWLDPEGIHRCLANLVSNAVDACTDIRCSHGDGRIKLQSFPVEGWAVAYRVEDNGCGMDEETASKVFQEFFSTKGSQGTGLGLMITQKIIHEHGGDIQVTSEEGEGSVFVIRLPKRDQPPGKTAR
jgi:signal transduction histidine kinase